MTNDSLSEFTPKKYPLDEISKLRIGLVVAEWNEKVVKKLRANCQKRLLSHGLKSDQISEIMVPGSFELPWGAKQFLSKGGYNGIICFGCVIQGETKHDDYINHAVAKAIMGLNLAGTVPVVFGVLTTNSLEQALERAGGKKGDKGKECADAVLKMISASQMLKKQKSKIGF